MKLQEIITRQSAYAGKFALLGEDGQLIPGPFSPATGGRRRLYETSRRAEEAATAMPGTSPVLLVEETEPCPGCRRHRVLRSDPDGTFCEDCAECMESRGIDPGWLVSELEAVDEKATT